MFSISIVKHVAVAINLHPKKAVILEIEDLLAWLTITILWSLNANQYIITTNLNKKISS